MRTDLYRDPRVSIMADILMVGAGPLAHYVNQNCQCDMVVTRNVMRNAAVGALLSVWGIARQRGRRDGDDLCIDNATMEVVDDICELPGFGEAMGECGWLTESDKGLVFPRFFASHNADPRDGDREKNRLRQQRFRESKRNVTRNVTNNARVEKSREEKREENPKEDSLSETETDHSPNPTQKVRKRTRNKQAEADALTLYEAYPIHKAKLAALKAIQKALRNTPLEVLLPKVQEYAASQDVQAKLSTPEETFIPRPATWFNAGSWMDEAGGQSRGAKWLGLGLEND